MTENDDDVGPIVECAACSIAGGAERAIYHAEPACPMPPAGVLYRGEPCPLGYLNATSPSPVTVRITDSEGSAESGFVVQLGGVQLPFEGQARAAFEVALRRFER